MRMKTNDGTPDAVKIACPVWNGGKGGDDFKTLPIIISRGTVFAGNLLLCLARGTAGQKKL
ncbi:MAG: hypothetical protein ACYDEX_14700 [Mobilitalea sp.]